MNKQKAPIEGARARLLAISVFLGLSFFQSVQSASAISPATGLRGGSSAQATAVDSSAVVSPEATGLGTDGEVINPVSFSSPSAQEPRQDVPVNADGTAATGVAGQVSDALPEPDMPGEWDAASTGL